MLDRLRQRLHIAVIYAGNSAREGAVLYSSFNTRPWKSYEPVAVDIAEALRRNGFAHVDLLPEDMHLAAALARRPYHFAWLNTAGVQGVNPSSHAPSTLEMLGVPYVGHGPLSVSLLDNKPLFKCALREAGFATPTSMTWSLARGRLDARGNAEFHRRFRGYEGPFVVKPAVGRASLHVHVVQTPEELCEVVAEVGVVTHGDVLIETFAGGREFVVAAAGPTVARAGAVYRLPAPFTFGAQERVLAGDELVFTSMDKRPITSDRVRPLDPRTDSQLSATLLDLAHRVYSEFQLSALIRLDVRADARGVLQILEANPKPDLKRPNASMTSLVGEGLAKAGMGYDDLILALLADRVDHLLRRQPGQFRHVEGLLA